MHYKQFTHFDYMGFWPIVEHVQGLEEEYILDGTSLLHELDGPKPPRGLMSNFWLTTPSGDIVYSTLPGGEPIKKLGDRLEISFRLTKDNPSVGPNDYWWEEREPVVLSPGRYAYYMMKCDEAGSWIELSQKDNIDPGEKLLQSIFLPKTEEELKMTNRRSFLAHDGLFHDDDGLDEEYAEDFGIDPPARLRKNLSPS